MSKILSSRDKLGFNFEMSNLEGLRQHHLYRYVKFRNPKNPYAWKQKIGDGLDLVLKIGDYTLYLEESFCSSSYPYRQAWFNKSRLVRFKNYPKPDKFHLYLLLTNLPENFEHVNTHNIQVINYSQLIQLINNLVNTTTNLITNTTNRHTIKSVYGITNNIVTSYIRTTWLDPQGHIIKEGFLYIP